MRNSHYRVAALLSFPVAVLLAVAAAGALFNPAVYAREAPLWAAQGRGQDWVDLVLVAPALALTAFLSLRGSRVASLLLAGSLVYTLYSLVLYAFFIHFGPLFLVYAWGLGLAFYALAALAFALHQDEVRAWFGRGTPVGAPGGMAVLLAVLFYALWLWEAVPAMASGRMPQSALDAGLITNPVQVLDLGLVLPAFIVSGLALLWRRPLGYWLCPTMLAFGVVMDVALVGMALSMKAERVEGGAPLGFLVAMTALTAGVLWLMLRRVLQSPDEGTSEVTA